MKKIGIVGSRRRDKYQDLKKINDSFLLEFLQGDEIVSGGCPKVGIDLRNLSQTHTMFQ